MRTQHKFTQGPDTQSEVEFRHYIEGLIPDAVGVRGASDDPPMEDVRDDIHDLVSDRAVVVYPNMDDDKRRELVRRVVEYFCGEE